MFFILIISVILKANTDLRFEDGTVANVGNGVYTHHIAILDLNKKANKPYECSDGTGGSGVPNFPIITGAAEETGAGSFSTPDGSFKAGFIVKENPKVLLTSEIVNYSNSTKNIYVVSDLDYLEGHPQGYADSGWVLLSVTQCDGKDPLLHPPKEQKKYTYKSKQLTITQDGNILLRRGHLHDGGEKIVMKLNDKVVCDSQVRIQFFQHQFQ
jgi:hypothetical protein